MFTLQSNKGHHGLYCPTCRPLDRGQNSTRWSSLRSPLGIVGDCWRAARGTRRHAGFPVWSHFHSKPPTRRKCLNNPLSDYSAAYGSILPLHPQDIGDFHPVETETMESASLKEDNLGFGLHNASEKQTWSSAPKTHDKLEHSCPRVCNLVKSDEYKGRFLWLMNGTSVVRLLSAARFKGTDAEACFCSSDRKTARVRFL